MSQFCRKCGTKMDDEDLFCPRCGEKVKEVSTAPQVLEPQPKVKEVPPKAESNPIPVAQAAIKAKIPAKDKNVYVAAKKKHLKNPFVIAVIMAIVILVIGFTILSTATPPYQAALELYYKTLLTDNDDSLRELMPKEAWENLSVEDKDVELEKWAFLRDSYASSINADAKYSIAVSESVQVSKRKHKQLAENLEDWYDVNSDQIKDSYTLKVSVVISGQGKQITIEEEVLAVCIKGQWYLLRLLDKDTMSAVFLIEEGIREV